MPSQPFNVDSTKSSSCWLCFMLPNYSSIRRNTNQNSSHNLPNMNRMAATGYILIRGHFWQGHTSVTAAQRLSLLQRSCRHVTYLKRTEFSLSLPMPVATVSSLSVRYCSQYLLPLFSHCNFYLSSKACILLNLIFSRQECS